MQGPLEMAGKWISFCYRETHTFFVTLLRTKIFGFLEKKANALKKFSTEITQKEQNPPLDTIKKSVAKVSEVCFTHKTTKAF